MHAAADLGFMQRALALAKHGLFTANPNPRVGCILVREQHIIAEGWHQYAGDAHAEIHALQQAVGNTQGATCYVTLEPCCHHGKTGPCCEALIKAGISRVVVAAVDPNPLVAGRGLMHLRAAGIAVDVGLLTDQAAALNLGFIKRMQHQMPYIRAKIATSLDGRTALANGASQWITGPAARLDNQLLRARSSAILTGVNTILSDDAQLTVRLDCAVQQPLRVIVDSQLRTPVTARCLQTPPKTLIATCSLDRNRQQQLEQAGAEIVVLPAKNTRVDLTALLINLAQRECNEIHVEAGAILLGALFTENLIDELIVYTAPKLLGNQARAMLYLSELSTLNAAIDLDIISAEKIGTDLKIVTTVKTGLNNTRLSD